MDERVVDGHEAQALIYARELSALYAAQKRRADELETAKRALEMTVERLKEAVRSREEFIASASHELLTPMTSILGWAEALKDGLVEREEIQMAANAIDDNGRRMLKLCNSLVKVASLSHEDHRVPLEKAGIPEILYAAAGRARDAGRRVAIESPPRLRARVHAEYLTDALGNFVDNAVKFAPEGTIALRA
ncbi:MAG: sensor histidine kinase, partial [Actinomycetota bacterium]